MVRSESNSFDPFCNDTVDYIRWMSVELDKTTEFSSLALVIYLHTAFHYAYIPAWSLTPIIREYSVETFIHYNSTSRW